MDSDMAMISPSLKLAARSLSEARAKENPD
jgi:hypothetical protein